MGLIGHPKLLVNSYQYMLPNVP